MQKFQNLVILAIVVSLSLISAQDAPLLNCQASDGAQNNKVGYSATNLAITKNSDEVASGCLTFDY